MTEDDTLIIVGADYGDIEMRIAAWYADHPGEELKRVVIDSLSEAERYMTYGYDLDRMSPSDIKMLADLGPLPIIDRPWQDKASRKTFKRNKRRQARKGKR